jgi:hypothetical protein
MVTCGGPIHWVSGYGWSYIDNVVVTAVPYYDPATGSRQAD